MAIVVPVMWPDVAPSSLSSAAATNIGNQHVWQFLWRLKDGCAKKATRQSKRREGIRVSPCVAPRVSVLHVHYSSGTAGVVFFLSLFVSCPWRPCLYVDDVQIEIEWNQEWVGANIRKERGRRCMLACCCCCCLIYSLPEPCHPFSPLLPPSIHLFLLLTRDLS